MKFEHHTFFYEHPLKEFKSSAISVSVGSFPSRFA